MRAALTLALTSRCAQLKAGKPALACFCCSDFSRDALRYRARAGASRLKSLP